MSSDIPVTKTDECSRCGTWVLWTRDGEVWRMSSRHSSWHEELRRPVRSAAHDASLLLSRLGGLALLAFIVYMIITRGK